MGHHTPLRLNTSSARHAAVGPRESAVKPAGRSSVTMLARLSQHLRGGGSVVAAAIDEEVRLGARRPHPRETPGSKPFTITVRAPERSAYQTMAQPLESIDYLRARLATQLGERPEALSLRLTSAPSVELVGGAMETLWQLGVRGDSDIVVQLRGGPPPSAPLPPGATASPPRVVRTAVEARDAVKRDGICIFELGMGRDAEDAEYRERAAGLAAEVFGDALDMVKAPVGVDDGAGGGGAGLRPADTTNLPENFCGCSVQNCANLA